MSEANTKRYRLTVPLEDREVINWMAAQANASWSLRLLIRRQIKSEGITDVTCGPVSPRVGRVGRPSKEAIAARDRALADLGGEGAAAGAAAQPPQAGVIRKGPEDPVPVAQRERGAAVPAVPVTPAGKPAKPAAVEPDIPSPGALLD